MLIDGEKAKGLDGNIWIKKGGRWVKDKSIINNIKVKNTIKKVKKIMNGQGRILVRKSGTESKIRVMGESENRKLLEKCINLITKTIK